MEETDQMRVESSLIKRAIEKRLEKFILKKLGVSINVDFLETIKFKHNKDVAVLETTICLTMPADEFRSLIIGGIK